MSRKSKKINTWHIVSAIVVLIFIAIYNLNPDIWNFDEASEKINVANVNIESSSFDLSVIPEYSGSPYIEINNNIPDFKEEDYTLESFERYSEWDDLGRSGVAFANVCTQIMPTGKRGEIGNIKDLSGWVQKRYDNIIKDKYLYNRCHLIGWQLSGENENKKNLITGTRYLNTEGMLPFENQVDDYIEENESNHVLYRVTPIYDGNNLLASGVHMEAKSIEDNGQGVQFNVYCYNVQPGIVIDYATGESHAE